MLVLAGVIEGFFSPSQAPVAMKFALAGVLFAVLLTYLFLPSRTKTATPGARFSP